MPCSAASRSRVSRARIMSPTIPETGPNGSICGKLSTLVGLSMPRQSRLSKRCSASSVRTMESSAGPLSFALLALSAARTASSARASRLSGQPSVLREMSMARVEGTMAPPPAGSSPRKRGPRLDELAGPWRNRGSRFRGNDPVVECSSVRFLRACLVVGAHDAADQGMANDVLVVEARNVDPLDAFEQADRFDEAGFFAARQVDLARIARDDHLGVLAQAGQEHLHLHRGGVLRL